MKENYNNITKYFRENLTVHQQCPYVKFSENYCVITMEDFKTGKLCEESRIEADSFFNSQKNNNVSIYIAIRTLKTEYEVMTKTDNNLEELTGIFFICANYNLYTGELSIPLEVTKYGNKLPFIPRDFLSPFIYPVITAGSLADYDEFLKNTTEQRRKLSTWSEYVNYAADAYYAITKQELFSDGINLLEPGKYHEFEKNLYMLSDDSIYTIKEILSLYNDILSTSSSDSIDLRLYKKLISFDIAEPKKSPTDLLSAYKFHCGQMGNSFPLSVSQRNVINHYSLIKEGDVLAVNGPPGTGKTTFIQTVVATEFVNHALKGLENPPVIFAASTNNQAVTNIIDSFGSIGKKDAPPLEQHWILGVNSFACYMPSKSKEVSAQKKGYPFLTPGFNGNKNYLLNIDNQKNRYESKKNIITNTNTILHSKLTTIAGKR